MGPSFRFHGIRGWIDSRRLFGHRAEDDKEAVENCTSGNPSDHIFIQLAALAGVAQITFLPYYNMACLVFSSGVVLVMQTILPLRRRDVVPVAWKIVVEGMDDAVLVLDAKHRLVDLNPKACALSGSSRSQALGHTLGDLWPGEKEALEKLLSPEEPAHDVVLTQGKEIRTFDVRVSALRDERGVLISQVLVLRDISERQEAELALRRYREHLEELVAVRTTDLQTAVRELEKQIEEREITQTQLERSEERLQILYEHAPEAYYLTDLKGTFIDGNRAAEELIGYEKNELIGASFLELQPPERQSDAQSRPATGKECAGKQDRAGRVPADAARRKASRR